MEHVGLDLPQYNNYFHDLAPVLIVDAAPRRRVDVGLKWLRMDEMAWFEASISVGDVNGACGLGFAQIKHLFS